METIIGFFALCPACDQVPDKEVVKHVPDDFWDEEPTNPGWPPSLSMRLYICLACHKPDHYEIADVANGEVCHCGGVLRAYP